MEAMTDSEIEVLVSRYAVGTKSGWYYLLTVAKNKASTYVSREDSEDKRVQQQRKREGNPW